MTEETQITEIKDYTALKLCTNLRAGNRLPSCGAKGAKEFAESLQAALDKSSCGLELKLSHCMGQCHLGPTLRLLPAGPFLLGGQSKDVPEIIEKLEQKQYDDLVKKFGKKDTDL